MRRRTLCVAVSLALLGATAAWTQQDEEDDAPKGKAAAKGKGGGKGKAATVDESAAKARAIPPQQAMQLVKPGMYLVQHRGANAVFRVTEEGVILVNTKSPGEDNFQRLLGYIQGVTKQPVKWVLNTGSGPEQAGNNDRFAALGARVIGGDAAERLGGVEVRAASGTVLLDKVAVSDLDAPEKIDRVLMLQWDRAIADTGQPLTRAAVQALKQ